MNILPEKRMTSSHLRPVTGVLNDRDVLTFNSVTKKFGALTAVNQFSAGFQRGDVRALIGPNGSGKTTLIKMILGLVIPDSGIISMDGEKINGAWAYRSRIGYMPQAARFPDHITVGELFDMMRDLRRDDSRPVDDELYRAYEIPALSGKRMHNLSGGMRQKVSAALAFMFSPDILILDEPTAGLDPLSTEILREKLGRAAASGALVLITSHVLAELDGLATSVTCMSEGRVFVSGAVDELQERTGTRTMNAMISALLHSERGIR